MARLYKLIIAPHCSLRKKPAGHLFNQIQSEGSKLPIVKSRVLADVSTAARLTRSMDDFEALDSASTFFSSPNDGQPIAKLIQRDSWTEKSLGDSMHKLLFIVDGQIDIGGDTGGWLVLRNHLIFIPANRPYSLTTAKDTRIITAHLEPGNTVWDHQGCWTNLASPLAVEMMQFSLRYCDHSDLGSDNVGKQQYFLTLSNLCRHWFDNPRLLFIPQAQSSMTRDVIKYVRDSLADATIVGACDAVGIPQRTLHRRCEKEFGMGLRALIGEVRMIRALELMYSSGQSVQSVAKMIGFASVPSFVAAFSKRFGKPPGQLMRENRNA